MTLDNILYGKGIKALMISTIDAVKTFINNNNLDDAYVVTDQRVQNLETRVNEWLCHVSSDEEKQIFLTLFMFFQYFTKQRIAESYTRQYKKFTQELSESQYSIFIPISSHGGMLNSAYEMMQIFSTVNEIDRSFIAPVISDYYNACGEFIANYVNYLVLVDDILGSGTTAIGFLEKHFSERPMLFHKKCVVFIVVVASEMAMKKIREWFKTNGGAVFFYYDFLLNPAFESKDIFDSPSAIAHAKKTVHRYEKKIASRDCDIMGYKRSQGLIGFYFNTPNNTLCTFWETEPKSVWNPIFPRKKSLGLPTNGKLAQIIEKKKMKDTINYNLKALSSEG